MSLKSFHIIFILVSSSLSICYSYYYYKQWALYEDSQHIVYLSIGIVLTVSLLVYGKWFLKKIAGINAK